MEQVVAALGLLMQPNILAPLEFHNAKGEERCFLGVELPFYLFSKQIHV